MARSAKKGPYVEPSLMEKVHKVKESGKREVIKTWSRRSLVIPDFVGLTFAVHNGRKHVSVFITENMVGHYLGEFVPTRTFRLHSGQKKAGQK
ncbi:MAG: 30S ribosomal protein S19 [Candidatus Dependentiae bacterium]